MNYPPIHPNCRCTTVMADAISKTRIARDPATGKNYKVDGDMTFEEWQAGLTDEQKAAMETHVKEVRTKKTRAVDNSSGSDIIRNINIDTTRKAFVKSSITDDVSNEICRAISKNKADLLFDGVKIIKDEPNVLLQTSAIKKGAFADIVLNINENALSGYSLQEVNALLSQSKSTIANTLEEAVIHEKYHAELINGLNYAQIERLYDELSNIHIDGISHLAYSDGAECIAETGVLLHRGAVDEIPIEALELFKKYIGEV